MRILNIFNYWGKYFFQNMPISETVIAVCVVSARHILSSFRPITWRKPCLNPISHFLVLQNSPDCHNCFSYTLKVKLLSIIFLSVLHPSFYTFSSLLLFSKYLNTLFHVLVTSMNLIKYYFLRGLKIQPYKLSISHQLIKNTPVM